VSSEPATLSIERRLTPDQAGRRERVVAAARALAAEGGYAAVSMGAVADRARLSRATLYRYFASKDHLLAEVIAGWGDEITAGLRSRPPKGPPATRVARVFTRVLDAATREPRLAEAVLASVTSTDPEAIRSQGRFATLIGTYLAAALGDEALPDARDLETLMSHVFFSAVVNMTTGRITHAEAVRVVETAIRIFFAARGETGGRP
jgi:AcrR family transcriptional regulator